MDLDDMAHSLSAHGHGSLTAERGRIQNVMLLHLPFFSYQSVGGRGISRYRWTPPSAVPDVQ